MELMIVVVITGVLAAIAIPTLSGYVEKSRTSEATQFLGVIKLRQEAYRSEFGQYLSYGGSTPVVDPTNITFVTPANVATDADFITLGAKPDGPLRFSYGWAAGTPAQSAGVAALNSIYGLSLPSDHYFVAQATADLDNDRTLCTFEVTSFTRAVWYTPDKGWE